MARKLGAERGVALVVGDALRDLLDPRLCGQMARPRRRRRRQPRMTAAPYSATMATVRKFNTEGPVRKGLERTVAEGVEQTRGYMDRCGAEAGHLVVSDRAPKRPWADKIFRRPPSPAVARRREPARRSRSGGCSGKRDLRVGGKLYLTVQRG